MLERSLPLPSAHDRVVEEFASRVRGRSVYVNVRGHHAACLSDGAQTVCPDILICDPETLLVEHIIEVETPETLSRAQASHWKDTAHAVRHCGKFWLLVPSASSDVAAHLCRRYGIPARIAVWSIEAHGLSITWPRHAPRVLVQH